MAVRKRVVAPEPERVPERAYAEGRDVRSVGIAPDVPEFGTPLGEPIGTPRFRHQQGRASQYRAMERKPLVGHYRGDLVYSVPAPVSSGAQLVETLNILDNYKPRAGATYTTDPDYLHYVIDS